MIIDLCTSCNRRNPLTPIEAEGQGVIALLCAECESFWRAAGSTIEAAKIKRPIKR